MSNRRRPSSLTQRMVERGFDLSRAIPFEKGVTIGCSQCQAVSINGVPCHERGCPNEKGDCEECGATIPKWRRICESCANPMDDEG